MQLDNEGGAALVAGHLLAQGHTRVGFLTADRDHPSMAARGAGFRTAMAAAGHALSEDCVATSAVAANRHAGADLAARLLDVSDRPTAVFCANDALALGFLDAARARGLYVPGDVAVVGFDDVEGAALAETPLTTVRVYKEQLGEVALGLLAERSLATADVAAEAARFARAPSVTRIATDLDVRASG